MAVQPTTPEEWLPVLTSRLDHRRTRIALLRSYTNGNAPLPEGGANVRAAWEAFQKKARTNLGSLVVDALAERLICNGVTVGQSQNDDDTARTIWRNNRMDVAISDTIRDMLTVSIGYMVIGSYEGQPVVTSELPEFMYAATDPLRPWVARAAVKVWRDIDVEKDYAYVWVPGLRQKFERPTFQTPDPSTRTVWSSAAGGWTLVEGSDERYRGAPPVVVFENHDCMGEFEPHLDILDRINKDILDRLVTTAMQAFRQRYLEGGLPPADENGNAIDYSAIFTPAPGALWDLPDGVTLKETQESAQSIMAMLSTAKDDIRDLAAVTRTPIAMLVPDGQNQSAAGSEFAKEGLVMKARDRIARIVPSLNEVMSIALRVVNPEFADVVNVGFSDPTHVSFAEKYDAAVKAKSADVPWRTRMISILGYSADEVDTMQTELEEERLALQLAAPPAPVTVDAAVAP